MAPLHYLFVVTYGRSGSTLVQGLLNTLPRTLIRGENNFYILPLYRAMVLARTYRRRFGGKDTVESSSAFYGLRDLRPERFSTFTRDLVVDQLLGPVERSHVDVIGFKEVHWHRLEPREYDGFFNFMDETFPGAQYVLNERRRDDVARSGFWRRRGADAAEQAIERVEQVHAHLRATRPERIHNTRYELLTSEDSSVVDSQLRALATFVTDTCDETLMSAMRHTLSIGHGPNPFGASHRWAVTGE